MKIGYWKNVGTTLFRETVEIKDGFKNELSITIEEDKNVKRKFLVNRDGVSFRLVRQESVIDNEEVIMEKHFTHKEFERIVENEKS
jgi:monomeric isocitrate dehydrogenase